MKPVGHAKTRISTGYAPKISPIIGPENITMGLSGPT